MTQTDYTTIPQGFYLTCQKYGPRSAQMFNPDLYHGDNHGHFTYQEMQGRVEKIGCGLMSLGLPHQTRIAIMAPPSPYWTQVDMAIACTAAVSVTIYPSLSLGEVEYIVNDSQAEIFFVGSKESLDHIQPGLKDMPSVRQVIVMDLAFKGQGAIIGLSQLMELGAEYATKNFAEYEKCWQSVTEKDWYTILYTSGTTGRGKGVILTHWAGCSRMHGGNEFFAKYDMVISPEDVTLCYLPLSHIFDRGSCQVMAILNGAAIAYGDKPGTLLQDMQKYNPTWINCVPRLYEKIYITFNEQMSANPRKKKLFDWALKVGRQALEYRKDEHGCYNMSPKFDLVGRLPLGLRLKYKIADKMFAKVRALFGTRFHHSFSASAGIDPELLLFFYTIGLAVVEGYGATETFNSCVCNPQTACKPGRIGIESNGGKARVAEDGELEIGGAGLFSGYLNMPEDTAESFTPDGWLKTGDLVQVDSDGYYRIIDRKKAIICLAIGKNVAPAKIENLFGTSSVVEQIFSIGDERNFIASLIVPNFNYFVNLFDQEKIPYDRSKLVWSDASGMNICVEVGDDFIQIPRLRELIDQDVKEANGKLEDFERIKKYNIISERFTEENGRLTPTQKTKKRVILNDYQATIDRLYAAK